MRKKVALSLALLLVSSSLLAACGGGGNKTADKPKDTKTLNWYMGEEPKTLDYGMDGDTTMIDITKNTQEGLFRFDKDGNPQPALAAGMPEVSADKKTYKFKLRDAKWSDGKPVTAKDFEFAWKRAADPKTASQYSFIMAYLENGEEVTQGKKPVDSLGVKALDDKTLEVKLKAPIPFFLDLVSFATYFPVREDLVKKFGKQYALGPDKMAFTGPFKIAEKKKNLIVLKKNENYWDKDKVKLETVNLHAITETGTALKLYETGQLDWSGPVTGAYLSKYLNHKDKFIPPYASSWVLMFNFKAKRPEVAKFLGNKKIRQAFNLSVDREQLVAKVFRIGKPAGAWVPPQIKVNGKSFRDLYKVEPPKVNKAEAQRLLKEGLKEIGMSAPPELELLINNIQPNPETAQFYKEQLRTNLGVNVKIKSVTFKQRLELTEKGDFELAMFGWGPDYNDPMTYMEFFLSDSPNNRGKWSNAEYDKLVKKSATNPNFEERAQDLIKAEKIFVEDVGAMPSHYNDRLYLVKPYVKGVKWHFIGGDFDLKEAYIESK
ncbi:peptide ABC transporter substrate-binding protein [Thermoflavimicrobium dichotomicum]|uniref:Oligopeptide transport system substrate-binding protein n=1 Tax=Thermoflavimicrobium dichotomicum TaxID=46223 RepID=A0A1I3LRE8_9BACL|nr:peptide ABC transporter substrate-binding protein [Thermoflavimicrobium dichotomicum]SFI87110.1 oligopeptide transport system substrate-binding protein [Thermoflavimicrobium dichotomicum]